MSLRLAAVCALVAGGFVVLGAAPASAGTWSCPVPSGNPYDGGWQAAVAVAEQTLNHSAVGADGPCPGR